MLIFEYTDFDNMGWGRLGGMASNIIWRLGFESGLEKYIGSHYSSDTIKIQGSR